MKITEDVIENMTCDLRNAMTDLLNNGPNDYDERRVLDAIHEVSMLLIFGLSAARKG